jgi:methionine synthase II (cobalamin-independent)
VLNKILENRQKDLSVRMHICRESFHSDYIFEGPYDLVDDQLAIISVD